MKNLMFSILFKREIAQDFQNTFARAVRHYTIDYDEKN
jgi:hypothetical protein